MDIMEERKKILEIFDRHSGRQGKRSNNYPDVISYNRTEEIGKELNYRWRGNNILKFEKLIKNDFENNIYTYGLLKCNWKVFGLYKSHQDRYFHTDIENGGSICNKVFNKELIKLESVITEIKKKYNYKINNYLYLIGISDNNYGFVYKKIGITTNINDRMYNLSTNVPFEYEIIGLWEIEIGKEKEIERFLHKKFNNLHKKLEWFIDYNNDMLNMVRNELGLIKKTYIKEVDPNTTIKYNYRTKDFSK